MLVPANHPRITYSVNFSNSQQANHKFRVSMFGQIHSFLRRHRCGWSTCHWKWQLGSQAVPVASSAFLCQTWQGTDETSEKRLASAWFGLAAARCGKTIVAIVMKKGLRIHTVKVSASRNHPIAVAWGQLLGQKHKKIHLRVGSLNESAKKLKSRQDGWCNFQLEVVAVSCSVTSYQKVFTTERYWRTTCLQTRSNLMWKLL